MKTIAFLISNLSNSGGIQRMLSLLCCHLADKYQLIVFVNKEGESFFNLDNKVEIVNLEGGNLLQKNRRIYKVLKKEKASYYINLDSNTTLYNGVLLPSFTELIVWEHFSLENNIEKWFFNLSRKYAVRRASKFVVLSHAEKKLWQERYKLSSSKTSIIPNPITIPKDRLEQNNNWANKKVLAIGNNYQVKGFDILIRNWKELEGLGKLIIAGLSVDQQKILQELIDEKGIQNVQMLGRIEKIAELYKKATVFVLSSRRDAMPLVLAESQAFGIPVVNYDHLSSVNEMLNDSSYAVSYDKGEEGLVDAISNILKNESVYLKYQKNSIENSKRFSVQKFEKNWKELLEKK